MSIIVFVAPLYLACYVAFSGVVCNDALVDTSCADRKSARMEQVELILLSVISLAVITVALFSQS